MDHSELNANPMVLFASFLVFLTYVYHKFLLPNTRNREEENYQEEYALEDHYANGPQVYNTNAHESSRFFMEEEHQPRSLRHRGQRELRNNHRNGQQYQQMQNEDIMIAEEAWQPEKESDLLFADVSAIHHVPKNKGNSLNNSFFENPFNEIKNHHREEFNLNDSQNSLSLEIPNGQNKGIYTRPMNSRRGPVYNDSSDSDNDIRVGSQKAKNPNAMEIVNEKQGVSDKRRYEDFKRNGRGNRSALDETNYEPNIVKKQQIQEIRMVNINGKPTVVQQEGIRVKEIYDYPFAHSNINKRDKDLRSQYLKNGGEEPAKKKDSSKRKSSEDHQDFMNKSVSLDSSYFEDTQKNSLKSHVAKKTVQEVAFRGKELMSDGDLKTIIGAKTPVQSLTSVAGASTQAKTGSSGGLFSSGGATNTSTTAGTATNTSTTTATASGTESQKKGLFSNDTQDSSATKSSGLFAPKASTTDAAAKPEEKKTEAARSSLFGSDLSPASKPSIPTPSLTKAESTAPTQATDENKGIPRVPTSTDLVGQNAKPAGSGLFSSLNTPASTLTTENKEPPKSALPNAGGLFGPASTEAKPTETKPAGSLFGNLASSTQSTTNTPAASQENKPAAPTAGGGLFGNAKPETKEDGGNKSTLFAGMNKTTSLFGENPPATTLATGNNNNNSSPTKPQTTTPAASTASTSLFGAGAITGGGNATATASSNTGASLFGDKGLADNKPAPPSTGLFGNKTQNQNKPQEAAKGTSLFGNLLAGNQGTPAGENKTETPAASSGGLFSNMQQNSNASAPKTGGLFGNFNSATANTNASAGGGSGLFSNMGGGSGSSLFGNK